MIGLTIKHSKVLDPISDLVEHFVLAHTIWLIVSSKSDDHESLFLIHYGLVNMPSCSQVGQDNGTHCGMLCGW